MKEKNAQLRLITSAIRPLQLAHVHCKCAGLVIKECGGVIGAFVRTFDTHSRSNYTTLLLNYKPGTLVIELVLIAKV